MTRRGTLGVIVRRLAVGIGVVWLTAWPSAATGGPPPGAGLQEPAMAARPQRLSEEQARQVQDLDRRIAALAEVGKFAEAADLARQVAELRRKVQSPDHWETRDAQRDVATWSRLARLEPAQRAALAGLWPLQRRAEELERRGQHAEARPLREEALALIRRAVGEDHPDTTSVRLDVCKTSTNLSANHGVARPAVPRGSSIRP